MATRFLRGLAFGLGAGLAGACLAAGNGIYQRETSNGAVELSNLIDDEDGQLLVAPSTVEPAKPAVKSSANRVVATRDKVKETGAVDEEAPAATDLTRIGQRDASAQNDAAAQTSNDGARLPSAANQTSPLLTTGNVPYYASMPSSPTTGGSATSDGSGTGAGASSGAGIASSSGTSTGSSSSTSVASSTGTGTGSIPVPSSSASPDERWAQYRDLMINQPLLANGLPKNPAVVRRYLMVDPAGYSALGLGGQ